MLKSNLYDYNDAYILAKGTITITEKPADGSDAEKMSSI